MDAKDFNPQKLNDSQIKASIDTYSVGLTKEDNNSALAKGAWNALSTFVTFTAIDFAFQFFTRGKAAFVSKEGVEATTKLGKILNFSKNYIRENPINATLNAGFTAWAAFEGYNEGKQEITTQKDAAVGRAVRELKTRGI